MPELNAGNMKVKDDPAMKMKEQVPSNERTQDDLTNSFRRMGAGLSKKASRLKRSFRRKKNKSGTRGVDESEAAHRVESIDGNREKTETMQLINENKSLREQLNHANEDHKRLKNDMLKQRVYFQQEKNDLQKQIDNLKQKQAVAESGRKPVAISTKQREDTVQRDILLMGVDFAGEVIPLDKKDEANELKRHEGPEEEDGPGELPRQPRDFFREDSDEEDSSLLTSPGKGPRRFASEDPRNFVASEERSLWNPRSEMPKRRNTVSIRASRRRQGLKLESSRGIQDMNRASAVMKSIPMGSKGILSEGGQLIDFVKQERASEWFKTFCRSDPRHQILTFFDDIAQEGADNMDRSFNPTMASPLLRMFNKASVFTVWRPTSLDAIRRMMLGEGVGKGLDIKGKSAKKGKLSGYVPYLQIYEEAHKKMVKTHPKDGKIKVFFKREVARDQVVSELNTLAQEMMETFIKAKAVVEEDEAEEDVMEYYYQKLVWEMSDTQIDLIDDYASSVYGMLVPERLFWEGMVVRQDISRERGSRNDTGRPSEPNFQNMNSLSLRKEPKYGGPKTVILQYEAPGEENPNPMDPRNLVMAYEEDNRVMPVVSDFDCFIVGTRGVRYGEPMENGQLNILKWCVDQIETVLDSGIQSKSWTSRWLDILKVEASKGFHPTIPPLGFSDPKSNGIMKHAINRLKKEGSVRHGAECFNYYFPQELDDEFLVICHDLPSSLSWCYVDETGLQDVLSKRIDRGYTFPINPKWILCDEGWKAIYDKLMASNRPNVQDSLRIWYPPEMGLREKIEEIHKRHPNGFQRLDDNQVEEVEQDGTAAMDLAEQELRAYLTFQRAKRKLRGIFVWRRLLQGMRKGHERKYGPSVNCADEESSN